MERRALNFNSNEESVLVALVKKYQAILECKKTGADDNNKKKIYWKKVEVEYNAQCGGTFRSAAVLQNKYKNIKKRSKKRFADEKCFAMGTGGGPPDRPVSINDIDIGVIEILGGQITGTESQFDDDAVHIEDFHIDSGPMSTDTDNNPILEVTLHPTTVKSKVDVEKVSVTSHDQNLGDWSYYTSEKLRTPKSKPLVHSPKPYTKGPKNKIVNKITTYVDSKTNSNNLKDNLLLEEHNLRMTQMKEKHEQEMRFAEEEHVLKMKILQQQLLPNT